MLMTTSRVGRVGQALKRGGASAFSPSQIPNMVLWLDADDTSTIQQTGGFVSQWNDKSGNGYNATQSVGSNQPQTSTRTINGLNCLDFNGVSHFMNMPSGLSVLPSGANTVFVVGSSDVTTNRFIYSIQASSGRRHHILVPNANSLGFGNFVSSPEIFISTVVDTTQHIMGFSFNGTSTVSAFYDNITSSGGGSSWTGATALTLGNFGSANFWDGTLCEVITFTRELNNSEISQVKSYLKAKWGTP